MLKIAGFWSYAHIDNENDGGRILSLANRLKQEFELISASPLELFVDRDNLQWGEEWERRIAEALQETTFFIPIITPNYFRHESCRKELRQFASASRQFGVEQLLLPIYYVDVPEFEADGEPHDDAMAIVKTKQWVDLRDLRLGDERDSAHRRLVYELAQRLLGVARKTEERGPTDVKSAQELVKRGMTHESPDAHLPYKAEGDSDAGLLDLLAKGEQALPQWIDTIQGLSADLQEFNRLTEESTKEIQSDEARGDATFARRLAAVNRYARRISGPAESIERRGTDYVQHLFTVDPAVRTMLRLAREDTEVQEDQGVRSLFSAIKGLTTASRANVASLKTFEGQLESNASVSRELRRPLRRINSAVRNMIDAQEMLDEWEVEIDDLFEGLEPSEPE